MSVNLGWKFVLPLPSFYMPLEKQWGFLDHNGCSRVWCWAHAGRKQPFHGISWGFPYQPFVPAPGQGFSGRVRVRGSHQIHLVKVYGMKSNSNESCLTHFQLLRSLPNRHLPHWHVVMDIHHNKWDKIRLHFRQWVASYCHLPMLADANIKPYPPIFSWARTHNISTILPILLGRFVSYSFGW